MGNIENFFNPQISYQIPKVHWIASPLLKALSIYVVVCMVLYTTVMSFYTFIKCLNMGIYVFALYIVKNYNQKNKRGSGGGAPSEKIGIFDVII